MMTKGKSNQKGGPTFGRSEAMKAIPGMIKAKGKAKGSGKSGKGSDGKGAHTQPDNDKSGDSRRWSESSDPMSDLAEALKILTGKGFQMIQTYGPCINTQGQSDAKSHTKEKGSMQIPATTKGKGKERNISAESRWSQTPRGKPNHKGLGKTKSKGTKNAGRKGKAPRTEGDWREDARTFRENRENEREARYQKAPEASTHEGQASHEMKSALGEEAERIASVMAADPDIEDGGRGENEAATSVAEQTSVRITAADRQHMIGLVLKGTKNNATWTKLWDAWASDHPNREGVQSHDTETLKSFLEFVIPTFGRMDWFRQAAERITWMQDKEMLTDATNETTAKTPDAPCKPDISREKLVKLVRAGCNNDKAWKLAWTYLCEDKQEEPERPQHMSTRQMMRFIEEHRSHNEMAWYQEIMEAEDSDSENTDDTHTKQRHANEIAAARTRHKDVDEATTPEKHDGQQQETLRMTRTQSTHAEGDAYQETTTGPVVDKDAGCPQEERENAHDTPEAQEGAHGGTPQDWRETEQYRG